MSRSWVFRGATDGSRRHQQFSQRGDTVIAVLHRDGNCSVVPSILINDRRFAVSFGPIPCSVAKSSTLWYGRLATINLALAGPIPGSVSSSSIVALLIFTRSDPFSCRVTEPRCFATGARDLKSFGIPIERPRNTTDVSNETAMMPMVNQRLIE